jgi:hypothetical protein
MSRALFLLALFASSPVALAERKTASLEGTWSSPSCKSRGYERRITFHADGTFRADDRVSPCPPNVACVWSGIITRTGTFKIAGRHVKLSAEPSDAPKAEPLPESLTFSKKGELSEGSCAYGRLAGGIKP